MGPIEGVFCGVDWCLDGVLCIRGKSVIGDALCCSCWWLRTAAIDVAG